MRWDGTIGFPGGFIKDREDPARGLNRELKEELGIRKSEHQVTSDDFLMAHMTSHFSFYLFAKEVSEKDFIDIERNSINAEEFGKEVLFFSDMEIIGKLIFIIVFILVLWAIASAIANIQRQYKRITPIFE
jgi:8-oxo-dGTP pyrophosphatase MutT (NUDIX family)